ncbi:hypothetical protein GCK32_011861 [Trichostrongylus colubriformis]|uniref:Uncharacterized protein n=1 Tax=Trichostrongylus colubriformis TaxID=6319 RepID=A0AAN8FI38_TRICO
MVYLYPLRFETGADPSESNNEKTSVSSSNKMLLVVELRKTTASSNQPARAPLVRSRNSHRRRPQSSSEPSISKSRSTGVMRKSESAHPTICSLDVPGPKPRRCGKPPPPVKPEGLSQRVKALNPNLGPIIVSEPTTQPSTRGSAAEHERTEETVPDKPTNVPSISRTPSNR